MKQVLVRKGKIELTNVPAPIIKTNEVLVEVAYSLISTGTEVQYIESSGKSLIKQATEQPKRVIKLIGHLRNQGIQKTIALVKDRTDTLVPTGYSCSGMVMQAGNDVSHLKPGDRVACAGAGIANHAEIVLVPKNLVAKIPDACDLKDAASVTLGAIAMQGVRRADLRLGEYVTVIGLGLLGQITVQLLLASGCQVFGIDLDKTRVDLARELGATAISPDEEEILKFIQHATGNRGVDATIITAASSSDSIVQQAMEITRKKGRVVVVGAVGLGLKRSPFYEKELDFLISCSYGPGRYDKQYEDQGVDYPYAYVRWTENRNMHAYLRLIASSKINLDRILDREYTIDQVEQAYHELQNASEKPLGVLLRYPTDGPDLLEKKLETKASTTFRSVQGKINIAMVGAGNFAKVMHLPNLKKLANLYHIKAIVDTNGSNALAVAERFEAEYATTNYQDVLDDPDVDAVMICTPHNQHAQQAIMAAQAGKGIFVEKPMAVHQQELDDLANVLRETGVPFMVGFNRRFSPAALRAKEILEGHINPLMILYRMNAGYLPPDHWTQTEIGGGRIIGEACHMIDLFQYLTGSSVVEVSSTSISPKTESVLAGDNMSITLRYEDGSVATLLYTGLGAPDLPKEYMEVFADGKVIVLDDYKELRVVGAPVKGWKAVEQEKGHFEELKSLADCIHDPNAAPITLDNLVSTATVSIIAVN